MEQITSRENEKIKYACRLAADAALRTQEHSFFAEGPKLCGELAKGCTVRVIYITQRALEKNPDFSESGVPCVLVTEPVAQKLAGVKTPQGVFGVFETPCIDPAPLLASGKRLLALEGVQDPGNAGTLLRSAAAFGFDGVLLDGTCASPFAPKTVRASMGAAVRIPLGVTQDLPAALSVLRGRGMECLAAALYQSEPLDAAGTDFPHGLCVVIGSEGQGLSAQVIAACSRAVRIPMTDRVESLNAGVAGSVLLWHFRGDI